MDEVPAPAGRLRARPAVRAAERCAHVPSHVPRIQLEDLDRPGVGARGLPALSRDQAAGTRVRARTAHDARRRSATDRTDAVGNGFSLAGDQPSGRRPWITRISTMMIAITSRMWMRPPIV